MFLYGGAVARSALKGCFVMPSDLLSGRAAICRAAPASPRRRTRVLALPEARWALAALVLFLLALPLQLLGAPGVAVGAAVRGRLRHRRLGAGLGGAARRCGSKTLDVDLLMVVAAIGAAAIGQVLDGALLIVIFATSGALEALATARTADSVRGLLDLAPATATRLLTGGGEETRGRPTSLAVGDTILVRPGERVGADGRVLAGASEVDQATITGEPLPVAKAAGRRGVRRHRSTAPAPCGSGSSATPSDSVIARIVAMVEEASETKAPTQLFIEKVEQRYSLGMVAATLAVFAVPLAFGAALAAALLRAMTFMIVASPCAVVLATMPPLLSAIANAGRHGVLVKSAVVMERLGQVDAVALDKTGTLTEGTPRRHRHPPAARLRPGRGRAAGAGGGRRAPQRTSAGPRRRRRRPRPRPDLPDAERLRLRARARRHRHRRRPHGRRWAPRPACWPTGRRRVGAARRGRAGGRRAAPPSLVLRRRRPRRGARHRRPAAPRRRRRPSPR